VAFFLPAPPVSVRGGAAATPELEHQCVGRIIAETVVIGRWYAANPSLPDRAYSSSNVTQRVRHWD
jgi:hypothetical protein